MHIDTWALVLATFAGPIAAVQAQMWVSRWRETRNRKLGIFRVLMNTRANLLSTEAVNAFNAIPIEFYGDEDVLVPWRTYFDHILIKDMEPGLWASKRADLYNALLYALSQHLDYKFTLLDLKNQIYAPLAHGKFQEDQERLRGAVLELMDGKRHVPVQLQTDPDAVARFAAVQTELLEWLKTQNAKGTTY